MHTITPTTVTCPYCDAKPGDPCTTRTGNIARTHADRVRVASTPDEVTIEETVEEVTDSDVDTLMSITHHKVSASDWSDQTTEGAMRRQEARDQANDLARTLTGPARRLLWATADGIDHLQAVLHDHGITPTTIEETTAEDTIDVSDIDRINRVFEESRAISLEINELLGVWDDGPIRILTDQEQARLDELLDKNRTLVDEMRILTKRITAARRTDQTEASPAPMTVRESSSGTWYVAKGGRWKVRLDGDDHATAVRDSTHVYRVVRELVVDTRASRSIRNPGHILDLVDRARRTANAAGRDDSPAHHHKKGPPPAASGGGHISLRKETQP